MEATAPGPATLGAGPRREDTRTARRGQALVELDRRGTLRENRVGLVLARFPRLGVVGADAADIAADLLVIECFRLGLAGDRVEPGVIHRADFVFGGGVPGGAAERLDG